MEFRQLRYFLKVVELGSISGATSTLNIAQPSLSLSLQSLEKSVGTQLLNRSGSGITLTPNGRVFERYARNIIRESEKALSELQLLRGGGSGRLSLGVMSSFAIEFVPQVVAKLLETMTSIDIDLHSFSANQRTVIEKLQLSEWDMALTLVRDDTKFPSDIEVRRIGKSSSRVYCCATHPLAGQKSVSLEDMSTYGWALTSVGEGEKQLIDIFAKENLEPIVKVRTNSLNQIISAATEHPLLFLAPALAISSRKARGELVSVNETAIRSFSNIAILYSNLSERTMSMRKFSALCASHASDLEKHGS